jgi:hypothetical protein
MEGIVKLTEKMNIKNNILFLILKYFEKPEEETSETDIERDRRYA